MKRPFVRGITPVRGLTITMFTNYLQTGMILQVHVQLLNQLGGFKESPNTAKEHLGGAKIINWLDWARGGNVRCPTVSWVVVVSIVWVFSSLLGEEHPHFDSYFSNIMLKSPPGMYKSLVYNRLNYQPQLVKAGFLS